MAILKHTYKVAITRTNIGYDSSSTNSPPTAPTANTNDDTTHGP